MRNVTGRALLVSCALSILALAGCATAPAPSIEYPSYKIGAPDTLVVTILPEPRIEQQLVVRSDGKITVELVGDVQAGGRTTQEVADEIEKRVARFKRGAVATVAVAQTASPTITVLGQVGRPGSIPLTRQIRVAEAISLSGDVTLFSTPGSVRVIRSGDSTEVIEVDLWEIRRGNLSSNIQLYPGDIIYVPTSVLARIGYALQLLLFPVQPLISTGTGAATGFSF